MKFKLMSILAGAIALTITAAPLAVKAQPSQPSGPAQNRAAPGGIKLTQQQKNQLTQISRDTSAQIQKVLTPQQRKQYQAAMKSSENRQRAVFAGMNLSENQKARMRAIMQSSQSRANAVLTPQQRQQIQQNMQRQR